MQGGEMEKKLGLCTVVGLGFGAVFGVPFGKVIEDPVLGIVLGALVGAFIAINLGFTSVISWPGEKARQMWSSSSPSTFVPITE
jgi:hypothetical protein